MSICQKHQREAAIFDLDLNQAICERCALFDPTYKAHSFLQAAQLTHHNEQLYKNFLDKLNTLQIQRENNEITCQHIRQATQQKISEEIELINVTFNRKIEEIEKERSDKIDQAKKQINEIADESKKSIKTLIYEEYLKLMDTNEAIKKLFEQNNQKQLCRALNPSLISRVSLLQKDLDMINLEFTNKLVYLCHDVPFFLPLSKKQSLKEQILINDIENQFICMFDSSLKNSRVSTKSNCKTQISFGSFQNSEPTKRGPESLHESSVSIESKLNALKVYNKSEVKNLYIKNSIKQITMTQLDMNNREAMEAIKKCSFNNFVSKIDLSYNQLTQKLITQLKREKIQSKYLKKIVAKGMKIDSRQLKKEGIIVNSSPNGISTITLGDLTIQY